MFTLFRGITDFLKCNFFDAINIGGALLLRTVYLKHFGCSTPYVHCHCQSFFKLPFTITCIAILKERVHTSTEASALPPHLLVNSMTI